MRLVVKLKESGAGRACGVYEIGVHAQNKRSIVYLIVSNCTGNITLWNNLTYNRRRVSYNTCGGRPIYCRIAEAVTAPSANYVSSPFFGEGCGTFTLCLIF